MIVSRHLFVQVLNLDKYTVHTVHILQFVLGPNNL